MAKTNNPTQFNLKVVRALRELMAAGDNLSMGAVSFSVPVLPQAGDIPMLDAVDLTDDEQGTHLGRCRTLRKVAAFAGDDPETLRLTWPAVLEALTPPRYSGDFPY